MLTIDSYNFWKWKRGRSSLLATLGQLQTLESSYGLVLEAMTVKKFIKQYKQR